MALNSGLPPGVGPYYENHGYQPESLYPPRPSVAPSVYSVYPAHYYPPTVPHYTPRVLTNTSTLAIRTQPKSPARTLCTSSRTLFLIYFLQGNPGLGPAFSSGLCVPIGSVASSPGLLGPVCLTCLSPCPSLCHSCQLPGVPPAPGPSGSLGAADTFVFSELSCPSFASRMVFQHGPFSLLLVRVVSLEWTVSSRRREEPPHLPLGCGSLGTASCG